MRKNYIMPELRYGNSLFLLDLYDGDHKKIMIKKIGKQIMPFAKLYQI